MQEIKELSEKEREEKIGDLREEYFNLKFQLAMGKIENPGRLKYMRRDIKKNQKVRKQRIKNNSIRFKMFVEVH
jgi:large subunit ribosomal protein L29